MRNLSKDFAEALTPKARGLYIAVAGLGFVKGNKSDILESLKTKPADYVTTSVYTSKGVFIFGTDDEPGMEAANLPHNMRKAVAEAKAQATPPARQEAAD